MLIFITEYICTNDGQYRVYGYTNKIESKKI